MSAILTPEAAAAATANETAFYNTLLQIEPDKRFYVLTQWITSDPYLVPGTGIAKINDWISDKGLTMTDEIWGLLLPEMGANYGDYPDSHDMPALGIFIALYSLTMFAYLFYYFKGRSVGHHFPSYLVLAFYSFIKVLGWGIRVQWAQDNQQWNASAASTTFIVCGTLFLICVMLYWSARLFTYRHPEMGRTKAFRGFMWFVYIATGAVAICGITGQSLPVFQFMTLPSFRSAQKAQKGAGILNIILPLNITQNLQWAYQFKPGHLTSKVMRKPKLVERSQEELPLVTPASWIDRTSLFWFPAKGSQTVAPAESIRVVSCRDAPAGGYARPLTPVSPSAPKFSTNCLILVLAVLIVQIEIICRVVSVFMIDHHRGGGQPYGPGTPVEHMHEFVFMKYPLYLFQGATEWLISVLLLVTRADLRYYVPDKSNISTSEATQIIMERGGSVSSESAGEKSKAAVVHVENV